VVAGKDVVMAQKRKRRSFAPQYRRDAAAFVLDGDRTVAEVADEIDVGHRLLGKWVSDERARREAAKAAVGEPLSFNERFELEQLRREKARLEQDVAFLKKAAAFFASGESR
jgi:transposase